MPAGEQLSEGLEGATKDTFSLNNLNIGPRHSQISLPPAKRDRLGLEDQVFKV
jgi:hypothetical protein